MSAARTVINKSLWTFIQTFASYWVTANVLLEQSSWEEIKTALLTAVGAGLLAVAKNLAVEEAANRAIEKQSVTYIQPRPTDPVPVNPESPYRYARKD